MALTPEEILKPLAGTIIADGKIVLGNGKILDTDTGFVLTFDEFVNQESTKKNSLELKNEIDFVYNVDSLKVDLQIITDNKQSTQEHNSGFLIEVYSSGSNGSLTRVYANDVIDVATNTVIQKGFSDDFILEVDVD